jgi:hypothetical protein
MNEPLLRISAVFCCIGMGAWPLMQRCGTCCSTAVEIAELVECEHWGGDIPALEDMLVGNSLLGSVRSFESVPNFAFRNFTQDHSMVEDVFSSPFQASRPGRAALWEVVENLSPHQIPRHVMFCTVLE